MSLPSAKNRQPYHLCIVAGAVLDQIRDGNTEKKLVGVPDLERPDKERRQAWVRLLTGKALCSCR